MAMQVHAAQRKRQCALFNALAIAASPEPSERRRRLGRSTGGRLAGAAAGWPERLAAGAIPVRLALEAAAYCADDAGRTERTATRFANQIGDLPGVPVATTHSFGQAILPGRQALPCGSAHI